MTAAGWSSTTSTAGSSPATQAADTGSCARRSLAPGDYLYVNQLGAVDELVAALDGGDRTLVSPGTDARWTLEILLGILASEQNGHNRVDLPLPRSGS